MQQDDHDILEVTIRNNTDIQFSMSYRSNIDLTGKQLQINKDPITITLPITKKENGTAATIEMLSIIKSKYEYAQPLWFYIHYGRGCYTSAFETKAVSNSDVIKTIKTLSSPIIEVLAANAIY